MRLLTYNIAFGCGRNNGSLRSNIEWAFLPNRNTSLIQKIGEFMKKQNPDIACIQEANLGSKKNGGVDQSVLLEKFSGIKKIHENSDTVIPFYLKLSNVVFTKMKPLKKKGP